MSTSKFRANCLLPNGNHQNFRGYDAMAGKASLYTGRKYTCDCGKQFFTREDRDAHQQRQRCGGAA